MNSITFTGATIETITSFDAPHFLEEKFLQKKIVDRQDDVLSSFPILPNNMGIEICQLEDDTKFNFIIGSLEPVETVDGQTAYAVRIQSYETRQTEKYKDKKAKEKYQSYRAAEEEIPFYLKGSN